ncbi:MAG: rhamnulokinase [Kiritimatiellae bacterium]|nr:rhamnulokinase [Kiritimatiellia bacterium]
MKTYLAIDIGASSGRHIRATLENGKIVTEEVYRFDNAQVRKNGHDCWDVEALARHVVAGVKAAGKVDYVGIDTWGVDFVLLDEKNEIVGDTVAYRDARTTGMDEAVNAVVPFADLYAKTGIQKAIFNTVYQLAALKKEHPEQLEKAARMLLVPDYLNFRLTGVLANEYTDASTSALVNARTKDWDWDVIDALGFPRRIFHPLTPAGTVLGPLAPAVRDEVGFDAQVVAPATHDTGSAYLAVPARDENTIYLSSGTWSLIGVENPEPITTPESQAANFSNEGGWHYRYRFLKNIMGLWMIQSIRRELNGVDYVEGKAKGADPAALGVADWEKGRKYSFADLEAAARAASGFATRVNCSDRRFFAPDSMIAEVVAACGEAGAKPATVGELVQCVYASLAENYAREAKALAALTGKTYTSLNVVGGGSKDGYLNELTKRATGLDVFAGPTEGTAIGNLVVQMIAAGEFKDLPEAREAIRRSFDVKPVL